MNHAYDVRLKEWRLARLQAQQRFSFLKGDICSQADLEGLTGRFRQEGITHIDAVVNLAARAGVRQSVENPSVFVDANITGTLNLLEMCRAHDIHTFVLASTSSVYGNADGPCQEDMKTDQPLSPYAASKKAAELMCSTYHHLYGMNMTVLRFFTVYGPGGRPDMSIFRFVRWIAEGDPVTVYGDGSQQRDFTFVDDTAWGVLAALDLRGFNLVNLGSDRPVDINAVIHILEAKLGRKASIVHRPAHAADVKKTWADISRANACLGWTPTTSLEDGLVACVEWYRQNRAWAREVAL
jgi:nucleoside-diphosphate-sugar epimerase